LSALLEIVAGPTEPKAVAAVGGSLRRQCWIPAALCLLGVLCFAIDIPVAAFFKARTHPKFLREVSENAEFFGHGIGVAFLIIAVAVLDPRWKRWVGMLLAGAYGGGLTADLLKLLIVRIRPRNFDLGSGTVWDTFGPLFSFLKHTNGDSHSFPSAHTATAFGFAVVLAAMYPRGKWLFFIYAALVGLHRVECSAHYLSDVCVGAAVGWVMGQVALWLRTRFEARKDTLAQPAAFENSSNA
jgi:membrane-associated phospholipid phosphatase